MPRVWRPRRGVSPFADLLVQRMTEHVPPLQPHHIAKYLGVDQTVISNWLNRGSIPAATVCAVLAVFFHDAPELWLQAAGRQALEVWNGLRLTPAEVQGLADRSGIPITEFYKALTPQQAPSAPPTSSPNQWEGTVRNLLRDTGIPEATKAELIRQIISAELGDAAWWRQHATEVSLAVSLYDPATWAVIIEQAEKMPWPLDRTALVIQSLRELQVAMHNRYQPEMAPGTLVLNTSAIDVALGGGTYAPKGTADFSRYFLGTAATLRAPEPKAGEKPAHPDDPARTRHPRRPRPT